MKSVKDLVYLYVLDQVLDQLVDQVHYRVRNQIRVQLSDPVTRHQFAHHIRRTP